MTAETLSAIGSAKGQIGEKLTAKAKGCLTLHGQSTELFLSTAAKSGLDTSSGFVGDDRTTSDHTAQDGVYSQTDCDTADNADFVDGFAEIDQSLGSTSGLTFVHIPIF